MWYSGGEQYEPNAIGYATSPDGLKWTKHADNPVFRPDPTSAWEKDRVTACQVVRHGELVRDVLHRLPRQHHAQIGLARSQDGITGWQRHPANPIIRPGKGQWDADAVLQAVCDLRRRSGGCCGTTAGAGGVEQIGVAIHEGEDLGFPGR